MTVGPAPEDVIFSIVSPAVIALQRMEGQTDVFDHIKMQGDHTAAFGRCDGEITSLAQKTHLQKIGTEGGFLGTVAGPAAVIAFVHAGACLGCH